jgi:hypothetical protein
MVNWMRKHSAEEASIPANDPVRRERRVLQTALLHLLSLSYYEVTCLYLANRDTWWCLAVFSEMVMTLRGVKDDALHGYY